MENYNSFLPDEMLNKLNRSLDTFYLKIREIIENKSLASQQKEAEIKKLYDSSFENIDGIEKSDDYIKDLLQNINNYSNGKIDDKELFFNLEKHKEDTRSAILINYENTFLATQRKEETEKTKQTLKELFPNSNVDNLNQVQLTEITNDLENPYTATLSEKTLEDLNLPRKDAEKIKVQYKYKVEGKITSGIGDLDTFLGIIQPGLNLILKTGAKLVYEGIIDPSEKVFFGNEELGIKSFYQSWAEQTGNLKKDYDFLHKFGDMPADDTFKYAQSVKKTENHVATYWQNKIIEQINKNRETTYKNNISQYNQNYNRIVSNLLNDENTSQALKDSIKNTDDITKLKVFPLLDSISQEDKDLLMNKPAEVQKFTGNPFDKTKDITETQQALQEIIKQVISETREKDSEGKPVAKATDAGKSALNSIMHLTDLFNKEDSPEFKGKFSDLIEYYKNGYLKNYGKLIENSDYFEYQSSEEAKNAEFMDQLKAMVGNSK